MCFSNLVLDLNFGFRHNHFSHATDSLDVCLHWIDTWTSQYREVEIIKRQRNVMGIKKTEREMKKKLRSQWNTNSLNKWAESGYILQGLQTQASNRSSASAENKSNTFLSFKEWARPRQINEIYMTTHSLNAHMNHIHLFPLLNCKCLWLL